jgi:hypothetical protein
MVRLFSLLITLLLSTGALTTLHAAEAKLPPAQVKTLNQKAGNGDLQAQAELAERYYKGDGVKQNYTQAAHWYKKLAETGVANAQLTLALMYIKGNGVEKNDEQAVHWLTQAAEQRMPMAQYLLGVAHAEGHGVKQDLIKAYMWYEIAAVMDDQNATAARAELAKKLQPKDIALAEQMAADWWLRFHQ